ncbi:MAG: DUF1553 domain-containing protein [Prosthecobacter sp.]|nr:DUF1553 domain-containing protein [Prosthecobacter sp.]
MPRHQRLFNHVLHGVFALVLSAAAGAEKLHFNKDIRPILSENCFFCHGPDAKKREADLRLDTFAGATADGAIVPGNPEKSEIIVRMTAHDPDDHMPPAKSKLPDITPEQVATLKQWIREGAKYEAHWSFIPLDFNRTPLRDQTGRSPIDQIVEWGLKEKGLALQPGAEANTLVRRLAFDLTGLPPSPAEVEAFVAAYAKGPDVAIKSLVGRLLASPRYGERMAVDWLDMARYADSYGFQVDRERDVWMWRDWVVKAFNENLPFDKFITWQLAGDMLPNPTDEQVLATAFNRLHQQESEGGSVEEEYRVEYVADRVQTVATAFLGLTFECARCHDHKFDPITQKEYYGLFSMFQNIDEAGLYSYFTPSPPTPALMLMDQPAKDKMVALKQKVTDLEKKLTSAPLASPQLAHGELAHFTFDVLDKNKLADALHPTAAGATLKGENTLVEGKLGKALQFTGDDAVDTAVGNFHRHDPFSVSLWLKTPDVKERAVILHRSRAWTDAASRGYELLIEEGKLKWSLIHFWPGNAISIRAKENLPLGQWVHVVVTNGGSSRAAGLRLYVNGKPAAVEVIRDSLTKDITGGGGGDNIALGERFRDRGFKGGLIDDLRVFGRDVSAGYDAKLAPLLVELKAARAEMTAFADSQKEIMVMRELPQPKKAYTLTRGEYDKHDEEVSAVTPVALSPFPKGAPKNRLGLAQWLTAPDHPLTARVSVNRLWQSLFGRGLVKTAEDFGSQGERPLYPELLDYLSAHLIESGWNMKALIEEIVTSGVYRQRSIADAKTMADDPENQWLARGPRYRLPAEMIRDNALASAGLLKLDAGGPPVNPYEMTEAFKPAKPTDTYRRSLYTTWRRTSPPPAMIAFDAPRRAVCAAKRERTDSPLQALILLNGTQYVEAARVLGEKLQHEAQGDVSKMIEQGFLRCLSRKPDARELEICQRLHAEQLAHFRAQPAEAEKLLKIGSAKHDASIAAPEAAAATVLAQALLNHDAAVEKR